MSRHALAFFVLVMLGICSVGCAGVSKDAQVKCPKCGAVFTIDEGLEGVFIGLPKPPK